MPSIFFAAPQLRYIYPDRTATNFFAGSPLSALTTLSFSDNVDLQRSAALAFAEITEKEVRPVGRDTLDPILFLLGSHDTEVQRAASAALGNLAVNSAYSSLLPAGMHQTHWSSADNKLLIVKLGGLEPLIRQMLSPNVEVQCNAVGCVTNLATHGESPVLQYNELRSLVLLCMAATNVGGCRPTVCLRCSLVIPRRR